MDLQAAEGRLLVLVLLVGIMLAADEAGVDAGAGRQKEGRGIGG